MCDLNFSMFVHVTYRLKTIYLPSIHVHHYSYIQSCGTPAVCTSSMKKQKYEYNIAFLFWGSTCHLYMHSNFDCAHNVLMALDVASNGMAILL